MPYAAGGQCFSTVQAAAEAVCSAAYPRTVEGGTVSCASASASGVLSLSHESVDCSGAECVTTVKAYTSEPAFPVCDLAAPYVDAAEMWLLVLAMLAPIALLMSAYRKSTANQ
jgi:hypothetical protein